MNSSMKMRLVPALLATAVIFLGASSVVNATEDNTIRAGVFVNPVGVVGAVEYEHLLGNRVSLGARLGYMGIVWYWGRFPLIMTREHRQDRVPAAAGGAQEVGTRGPPARCAGINNRCVPPVTGGLGRPGFFAVARIADLHRIC